MILTRNKQRNKYVFKRRYHDFYKNEKKKELINY